MAINRVLMEHIKILLPYAEEDETVLNEIAESIDGVDVSCDEYSNSSGELLAVVNAAVPILSLFITTYYAQLQLKEAKLANSQVRILSEDGRMVKKTIKLSELSDWLENIQHHIDD